MYKYTVIFLALLMLASCSIGSSKNSAKKVNGNAAQGIGQGNGMITYVNAFSGIKFQYPATWSLTESNEGKMVDIENNQSNNPNGASKIEFESVVLLKGNRIKTINGLLDYLSTNFPDKKWTAVSTNGNQGFYSKVKMPNFELGSYYIFNQNDLNIVRVDYQAVWNDSQALAIVGAIVNAVILDADPPVVNDVEFIPKDAHPGEIVKLVIKAHDSISGVDIEGFNGVSNPLPKYAPNMGYINKVDDGHGDIFYTCVQCFRLNKFVYKGDDTYETTFIVPVNAPSGEMMLVDFNVADHAGNIAYYRSQQGFSESNKMSSDYGTNNYFLGRPIEGEYPVNTYINSVETNLKKVFLNIKNPSNNTNYRPDTEGPKLIDAYFDRTSVTKSNPKINLFLEFEDESGVNENLILIDQKCYNHNPLYQIKKGVNDFWDYVEHSVVNLELENYEFPKVVKISKNKFKLEFDATDCYDYSSPYASLDSVISYDLAGNKSYNYLPSSIDFGLRGNSLNQNARFKIFGL